MPVVKKKVVKKSGLRKATKKKSSTGNRPVKYKTKTAVFREGKTAITARDARMLLGWEEESDTHTFGNKYSITCNGKKVRLNNNINNRPIYQTTIETLKQEHLRKRWRMNCEPIIIGRTGLILNGQHTLISLVLAVEEWETNEVWKEYWPKEPTMDKLLVCGAPEDDDTVNTMDTCKPRSLMDVIYRTGYFKNLPVSDQKVVSKMLDYCIRRLWRTVGDQDAYSIRRTHSESIAFLELHPKCLDAVRFIYEEDDGKAKSIAKFIPAGTAAAMLYLQACSNTNPDSYYTSDKPTEELLDMSLWEKACSFWTKLAKGDDKLNAIKSSITALTMEGSCSVSERWAILVKAWNAYKDKDPITKEELALEYDYKDNFKVLIEEPLLGGIDVGEHDPAEPKANDPSEEDIKRQTSALRKKRSPNKRKASMAGKDWAKGDTAWVCDDSGEPYFATINKVYDCLDGTRRAMVSADDGDWEVKESELKLTL